MTIWDLYTLQDFIERLIEKLKSKPNLEVDITGDELISISQRPYDIEEIVERL